MSEAPHPDGLPASAAEAEPAPPCTLVIFGASGDLTHRLLVPALYNLARAGLLSDATAIVGISRSQLSSERFRDDLREAVRRFVQSRPGHQGTSIPEGGTWERLLAETRYLAGDLADPATYAELADSVGDGNALFYLAVAPDLFGPVVQHLAAAGLTREREGRWRRVIVEKPFGHDLASAQALNRDILAVLSEAQVFRMDHFLGKETVQNIVAMRFGNGLFEPLWNRNHIDHVQITVAETVGVEKRGRFYEATGALRDMVPNHLFQLLALTAMEPPTSFAADAVRDRKEDVMQAVRRMRPDEVASCAVRGQYLAGEAGGRQLPDYRGEAEIAADSRTETFVALRLAIDTWRWAGVPFYLRTGKAMSARDTEIAIRFREAPLALFRHTETDAPVANWLVVQLQPDEGISLQFGAKRPGPAVRIDPVLMRFCYKDYFQSQPATGYETLIYDAMIGDATLFQRADTIEAGWRAVQPLLDAWSGETGPLPTYPAGSDGPVEAADLLARDGRAWRPVGAAGDRPA